MEKNDINETKENKLVLLFDTTKFKKSCENLGNFLYRLTLYSWLCRKTENRKKYDIAGGYIAFFALILIILLSTYSLSKNGLLLGLIAVIAFYRLFDLFITHVHNIVLKHRKGVVPVRNAGRFISYAILNFFEIIISISALKLFFEVHNLVVFSHTTKGSVLDALYFTIVTLVTLGYGDIHPVGPGGKVFVIIQIIYFACFLFFVFPVISSAIKVTEDK